MSIRDRKRTFYKFSIVESYVLTKEEVEALNGEEFVEEDDFSTGIDSVSSAKPRLQRIEVYHEPSKRKYSFTSCGFIWTYSWLKVIIATTSCHTHLVNILSKGIFTVTEYELDDKESVSPISIFLDSLRQDLAQKIREDSKKDERRHQVDELSHSDDLYLKFSLSRGPFLDFAKQTFSLRPEKVRISKIFDLLSDYENQPSISEKERETRFTEARTIRRVIQETESGGVLEMAIYAKEFFRLGGSLFPKKMVSILRKNDDKVGETLAKRELHEMLNEMIMNEPWKVGFSELIFGKSKNLTRRWSGLEAPLKSMKEAPFYLTQLSSLHRDSLHVYDVIKEVCRHDGHTHVSYDDIKRNYAFLSERRYNNHHIQDLSSVLLFLVTEKILHRDVVGTKERFHLKRYWRAEEKILKGLKRLICQHSESIPFDIERSDFVRIRGDAKQTEAAKKIFSCAVTIISGRGGTGKTEVVTAALNAVDEYYKTQLTCDNKKTDDDANPISFEEKTNSSISPEASSSRAVLRDLTPDDVTKGIEENSFILYTAPTGKAAAVMRKRSGRKAFTMHQILASCKSFAANGGGESGWKFANTKVLAVDESSMVSLELFASLITCLLENSQLAKVVLLGDVLQLPSIEPGNLMCDLFTSLQNFGSVVELVTNHRSEGSLIFQNADRVSRQDLPIFDRYRGFHLITDENPSSLPRDVRQGAECLLENLRVSDVIHLQKPVDRNQMSLQKDLLYLSLLKNYLQKFQLEDQKKSQFIAFRRAECQVVNEFCCMVYNNHKMYGTPEVNSGALVNIKQSANVLQFRIGDKIMCTKNSDVQTFVEPDKLDQDSPKQSKGLTTKVDRLMNGNVYVIEGISRNGVESEDDKECSRSQYVGLEKNYYILDDLGDEIVRPRMDDFHRFCKPLHAWALTIHKFQGSEAETVVYGVSDSKNETWQHVYTALTRGRKRVVIVGRWVDLEKAVKRKPRKRQTSLAEKVSKFISEEMHQINGPAEDNLFLTANAKRKLNFTEFKADISPLPEVNNLQSDSFDKVMSQMTEEDFDLMFSLHSDNRHDAIAPPLFDSDDSFEEALSQLNESDLFQGTPSKLKKIKSPHLSKKLSLNLNL